MVDIRRLRRPMESHRWGGRTRYLALLSMFLFGLCARGLAETWVIEPDRGVGPLQFGISSSEVLEVLDICQPTVSTESQIRVKGTFLLWFHEDRLRSITVEDSTLTYGDEEISLETSNKLKVGSLGEEFAARYGPIYEYNEL